MMIAFSTETWSLGSFSMTHWRICTSSPSTARREKSVAEGSWFSFMSCTQAFTVSTRYRPVKLPR